MKQRRNQPQTDKEYLAMRIFLKSNAPGELERKLAARMSEKTGEKFVDAPNPWEIAATEVSVPEEYVARVSIVDEAIYRGHLKEGKYRLGGAIATVRTLRPAGEARAQKIEISATGVAEAAEFYGLLRSRSTKVVLVENWETPDLVAMLDAERRVRALWYLKMAIAFWIAVLLCLIGVVTVCLGKFYYQVPNTPGYWIPLVSPFFFAAVALVVKERIFKWKVGESSPM